MTPADKAIRNEILSKIRYTKCCRCGVIDKTWFDPKYLENEEEAVANREAVTIPTEELVALSLQGKIETGFCRHHMASRLLEGHLNVLNKVPIVA
jgi:hypothetical protein